MAKSKGLNRQADIKRVYLDKYFSIWCQSRTIKGLSYEQSYYVMRQLFEVGSVLCFKVAVDDLTSPDSQWSIEGTKVSNGNTLVFTPYAPQNWNMYNFPPQARAINIKGSPFIPTDALAVNRDCVIIWCNPTHRPMKQFVNYYIEEIVNIQVAIDMNLYANRIPKLIAVEPEDENALKSIKGKIDEGENCLFVAVNNVKAVTDMTGSRDYVIDKLFKHKQEVEGDLLTIMGLKNLQFEKAERITDEEASSNNDVIQLMAESITQTMQEGIDKINELFGTNLELIDNISPRANEEQDLALNLEYSEDSNNESTSSD